MKICIFLIVGVLFFSACHFPEVQQKMEGQFSDQNFKTSISLIELYKIRYGRYPASLDSLTFMGDWDKMIYGFVKYERLDTGYRLDIVPGPMHVKPGELSFPSDFWRGIGLRRSNVRRDR
jgi:hypothetical protein